MSNWLTSTIQSVRDQSFSAFEFVRKDLSEFTSTVKNDTRTYLRKKTNQPCVNNPNTNEALLKLNNAFPSSNDYSGHHVASSTSSDRLHKERVRIQNDESTYLTDPMPIEVYRSWCEESGFSLDKHKEEIAQLLINNPQIRLFNARFVPTCTTHHDFWSRYYYRQCQLDDKEKQRQDLLKRAHEICNQNNENEWDEPDEESKPEILSEQTKANDTNNDQHLELREPILLRTSETDSNQCEKSASLEITNSPKKLENELEDEWETWS